MLLRLLKNNHAGGVVFIFILMILIWVKSFIQPISYPDITSMPLYNVLFSFLRNKQIATILISIACYTIIILLLIRLNVVHFLLEERSYMPASFYLLIAASYPPSLIINPILISCIFLLSALVVLIKGNEHQAEPMSVFNSALIICIGSLFYLKIIWFIPFLWITGAIIRPLKWRGFINPLLIILMFILFYTTYFWVFKDNLAMFSKLLSEQLSVSGKFHGLNRLEWMLSGYLLFLLSISGIHLLNKFQGKKIIIRKIYQILILLFIYCLIFCFLISGFAIQTISLLAIPAAYLFAHFFHRRKSQWIHEVLLWIWLGMLVYINITS